MQVQIFVRKIRDSDQPDSRGKETTISCEQPRVFAGGMDGEVSVGVIGTTRTVERSGVRSLYSVEHERTVNVSFTEDETAKLVAEAIKAGILEHPAIQAMILEHPAIKKVREHLTAAQRELKRLKPKSK